MAGTTLGDEVAIWSGRGRTVATVCLWVVSLIGAPLAAFVLYVYRYRYNLIVAAIIFDSSFGGMYIFCGGFQWRREGQRERSYNPLHPLVRTQLPRIAVLHAFVCALIVIGGLAVMHAVPKLSADWMTERGVKHHTPLEDLMILIMTAVVISEVAIARHWLKRAVERKLQRA